jgi:hypothetical protein
MFGPTTAVPTPPPAMPARRLRCHLGAFALFAAISGGLGAVAQEVDIPRQFQHSNIVVSRVHSERFLSAEHIATRMLLLGERPDVCCVIGSSPQVMLTEMGAAIDSTCSVVMRANFAPVRGYEEHVGSRTDVRVMAHTWVKYKTPSQLPMLLVQTCAHSLPHCHITLLQNAGAVR